MIDQSTFLFDFPLFSNGKQSLLKVIKKHLRVGKKPLVVFTPNPEQIVQSRSNASFGRNLHAADVLIPDGIGLVWASKLLAARIRQRPLFARIAGSDLVTAIVSLAELQGNILIIGGQKYAGHELSIGSHSLVVGKEPLFWTPGYTRVTAPRPIEEAKLIALLNKLRPKVVFVAFGAPNQEAWILDHQRLLEKSEVKVAMSVGGAFDMLLNLVPRAPSWVQGVGFEWLFRLVRQPWRWLRQLRLLVFGWLVVREFIHPRHHLPEA